MDWNLDSGSWMLAQTIGGQPVNAVGVPGGAAPAPTATNATTAAPGGAPGPGQPVAKGPDMIFWLLPGMLLVMVLVSVLGGRKEKKKRAELMASLKKGDKVQTLGGIIGTIAELGEHDAVIRLEDGRMRIARTAIQGVVGSSPVAGSALEAKPEGVKAGV